MLLLYRIEGERELPGFTSFSEITLALQKSRLHQFALGIRQLPAMAWQGELARESRKTQPEKDPFCDCRHSVTRQQVYSSDNQSRLWAETMRETASSVHNKALAQEGAAKIPPKEFREPDFSNGTAGNDRRNWLFWLAA